MAALLDHSGPTLAIPAFRAYRVEGILLRMYIVSRMLPMPISVRAMTGTNPMDVVGVCQPVPPRRLHRRMNVLKEPFDHLPMPHAFRVYRVAPMRSPRQIA